MFELFLFIFIMFIVYIFYYCFLQNCVHTLFWCLQRLKSQLSLEMKKDIKRVCVKC